MTHIAYMTVINVYACNNYTCKEYNQQKTYLCRNIDTHALKWTAALCRLLKTWRVYYAHVIILIVIVINSLGDKWYIDHLNWRA